jgi:hypothetical protein
MIADELTLGAAIAPASGLAAADQDRLLASAVRGFARCDPVTFQQDLVRGGATFVEPTPHVRASVAPASLTRRLPELRCSRSLEAILR